MEFKCINLEVVVTKIVCVFFESNSRLVLETVMTSSFALVENLATLTKDVVTKCNYKLFCLFSYHNH